MRSRTVLLLLVPVAVFIAIWLGAAGECGPGASCIANVRVEGRQYSTAIARSMLVAESDLAAYARATRIRTGLQTIDDQTYRLGSIDPTKVLVMKLVPGQSDGAGPIGDYLLLVADETGWGLTCPYFTPGDPLSGCP